MAVRTVTHETLGELHPFKKLRDKNELLDAKLLCTDSKCNQIIHAHRIVLASVSSGFKRLLKTYPNPEEIVPLKNQKHDIILSIIELIYNGKIVIPEYQHEEFKSAYYQLNLKLKIKTSLTRIKPEQVLEQFKLRIPPLEKEHQPPFQHLTLEEEQQLGPGHLIDPQNSDIDQTFCSSTTSYEAENSVTQDVSFEMESSPKSKKIIRRNSPDIPQLRFLPLEEEHQPPYQLPPPQQLTKPQNKASDGSSEKESIFKTKIIIQRNNPETSKSRFLPLEYEHKPPHQQHQAQQPLQSQQNVEIGWPSCSNVALNKAENLDTPSDGSSEMESFLKTKKIIHRNSPEISQLRFPHLSAEHQLRHSKYQELLHRHQPLQAQQHVIFLPDSLPQMQSSLTNPRAKMLENVTISQSVDLSYPPKIQPPSQMRNQPFPQNIRLWIGNLPIGVHDSIIEQFFHEKNAPFIANSLQSISKGGNRYGFIDCPSREDANAFIRILNGVSYMDMELQVELKHGFGKAAKRRAFQDIDMSKNIMSKYSRNEEKGRIGEVKGQKKRVFNAGRR